MSHCGEGVLGNSMALTATPTPKLKVVHGNFHIESTVLWNLGSNKSPSGKTEFPYLHERLISKLVVGSWVAQVLCTYSGKAVSSQRGKTGSMLYCLLC